MDMLMDYEINEKTIALKPAYHTKYDTIVYETGKQFYIKKPAFQLIQEACLHYGSSYDGRKESVIHHTGYKRKVPIPISISKNIFTFPTHSPSDFNCAWIFYKHVESIKRYSPASNRNPESIVIFKNGMDLTFKVSPYILEKQMQRTAICEHGLTSVILGI